MLSITKFTCPSAGNQVHELLHLWTEQDPVPAQTFLLLLQQVQMMPVLVPLGHGLSYYKVEEENIRGWGGREGEDKDLEEAPLFQGVHI